MAADKTKEEPDSFFVSTGIFIVSVAVVVIMVNGFSPSQLEKHLAFIAAIVCNGLIYIFFKGSRNTKVIKALRYASAYCIGTIISLLLFLL